MVAYRSADKPRRFLSLAAAAERADVDQKTIRRYIAAGRLPASRMGDKLIRIAEADLDALFTPISRAH